MKSRSFVATLLVALFALAGQSSSALPLPDETRYVRPMETPLPSEYEWIYEHMPEPAASAFAGLITEITDPDANVSAILRWLFETLPDELPICFGFVVDGLPLTGLVEISSSEFPDSWSIKIAGYGREFDGGPGSEGDRDNSGDEKVGAGYYYAMYNPNMGECA